jgi:hypothetical protein
MAIRLNAAALRKIIREEVIRAKTLAEARDDRYYDIRDASIAIYSGDTERGFEMLASLFADSPAPSKDITAAILKNNDLFDEKTAYNIGRNVVKKHMPKKWTPPNE